MNFACLFGQNFRLNSNLCYSARRRPDFQKAINCHHDLSISEFEVVKVAQ